MDASAAQAPLTTESPLANGQSQAWAKYVYLCLSKDVKVRFADGLLMTVKAFVEKCICEIFLFHMGAL